MDKEKKIKFNFEDNLGQLKSRYDQFANDLINKSKNFSGGSSKQQNQYIQDEIRYYKELYEAQKKFFDQSLKDQNRIKNQESNLGSRFRRGEISQSVYDREMSTLNKEKKELLSGTGRRKFENFAADQRAVLDNASGNINGLEKLLENSNNILRQILGQDKDEAAKTIKAIEKNQDATPEEKLAASQAKEALAKNKKTGNNDSSIVGDILRSQNLRQLFSNAAGIGTAQSGVQAAKHAGQAIIDGVIGAADSIGFGAGALARAGGVVGQIYLDNSFAAYEAKNKLNASLFSNRALSGRDIGVSDMSKYGYSFTDFADTSGQLSRARGSSKGVEGDTRSALLLERGYGINREISSSLAELVRGNKDTDRNLISIVGGIYSSGKNIFKGDRAYLGEFIQKNFTSIQKELIKNTGSVGTGTVMDVLNRFNAIGGQFGAKNSNSLGLISQINSSLTNPNGGALDALSFAVLRRSMPGASMTDILKEREKGLGSSTYLNSLLGGLDQMGGSDDFKVKNLSGAFGISVTAADSLYKAYRKNPGLFKNMSQGQLNGVIGGLDGMAAGNTTSQQSLEAGLFNQTVMGEKFVELMKQMVTVVGQAFDGATYTIDPATGVLKMALPSSTKKPPTKTYGEKVKEGFSLDHMIPGKGLFF